MLKKKTNRIISFFAAFIIALTVFHIKGARVCAQGELPPANTAVRHTVCTALSDAARDYYKGEYSYENLSLLHGAADISDSYAAMQNNELFDALRALMSGTHAYYTKYSGYKKGALAYYWPSTDAVAYSSTYIMFYSDTPADEPGAVLNREHIWPKSRASFAEKNGGADLHHLRPSLETVNKAKSNHAFGYVNGTYGGGYTVGRVDGEVCYYLNTKKDLFECKDDVKGDVARILLYVYCRWGQPNLYSDITGGLPEPDSDDTQNTGDRVIESLDTLLKWCECDPVDEWEMARNDLTEEVQGNRNVFIDYPELAFKMFGVDLPVGFTSPTRSGCEHKFTETHRQNPTYENDGFYTLNCQSCGNTRTMRLAKYDADNRQATHIPGDINGDLSVNNRDLTLLFKYHSDWEVEVNTPVLDVNGDGRINNKDITRLFQYLSGWNVKIYR